VFWSLILVEATCMRMWMVNPDGNVDSAIYAIAHAGDDATLVFVMAEKLSHANLQTNPKAADMFVERAQSQHGV